ncbi:hypothetical protein IWX75_001235 [Arthrobacter sp. CAN_A6]|uniref:hypothetical protein n=1 Tax=Arthrobacter sp. CAN_A6 TaxID=2787721 RepID=UPI0018CA2BCD
MKQGSEPADGTAGRTDRETLNSYLDMHLFGATNGVRLFEAASRSWADTQHGRVIAGLEKDIAEERRQLRRVIERSGHRPGRVKMLVAHGMARLAEVNPVNPWRRKTSTGAQLELESLLSLLRGKESLWETLIALRSIDPAADGLEFSDEKLQELLEEAREQQSRIAEVISSTAADRFLKG